MAEGTKPIKMFVIVTYDFLPILPFCVKANFNGDFAQND